MRIPIVDTYKKNKEAKSIIEDAQYRYDKAQKKMERQRQRTSDSLELLGKLKLEMLSEDIGEFTSLFKCFKDVKIAGKIAKENPSLLAATNVDYNMDEIQMASVKASEVFKGGVASLGTGALAGIASYGAVSMLGHASTGAAISSLQGIAAQNATLAWFGGGSIAAGGAGIAGGTLVLGGIVVLPMLLVADSIMSAKADENLAKAEAARQEAKLAAEKMNTVRDFMYNVEEISNDYITFLNKIKGIYKPLVQEMRNLIQNLSNGFQPTEKISFENLTESQKKLLQINWLMTQVLYCVLKAPLLTRKGDIQNDAPIIIESAGHITDGLLDSYNNDSEISNATLEAITEIQAKTRDNGVVSYIRNSKILDNEYVKRFKNFSAKAVNHIQQYITEAYHEKK